MKTQKEELKVKKGIVRAFELGELNSFDPFVLLPKDKDDSGVEKVCNFMLLLALFYNDSKYLHQITVCIEEDPPKSPNKLNKHSGQYEGIKWYVRKLYFSIIRELIAVISNSDDVLVHPLFKETMRHLPTDTRERWNWLINIIKNINVDKPEYRKYKKLKELFERIRNHVSSHYDFKYGNPIVGYKEHFKHFDKQRAYIALGNSMAERKPFFADCIVSGYFAVVAKQFGEVDIKEFYKALNHPLWDILISFIQVRGGSFRPEQDDE